MNEFFLKSTECCGCASCFNACKTGAIHMQCDEIGFLYPKFDRNKCVNCGKCISSCPVVSRKQDNSRQNNLCSYAGFIENNDELLTTASGGIATSIAKSILKMGGVVYGVEYTKDYCGAKHIRVCDTQGLDKIKNSKYIQSEKGEVYNNIEKDLKKGKKVLFTGTPCEVAAVYSYLGKDYDNLLTVELICHGPTSGIVQKKYIEKLEREYGSKVDYFSVRNKDFGWKVPKLKVGFINGQHMIKDFYSTELGELFCVILRESCLECQFKGGNKRGDITVGDYWGIDETSECWNKNGVSCIIIHNEKAKEYIDSIEGFKLINVEYESIEKGNPLMIRSAVSYVNRKKIVDMFLQEGIDGVLDYIDNQNKLLNRIKRKVVSKFKN